MAGLMGVLSRPRVQRIFIAAGVVAVALQWVAITQRRASHLGDFDVSREFGRRFLAREYLYAGGTHYPYMPSAAMYFAPLAMVAPSAGIAVRYGVALGCLLLTFRMLHSMVRPRGADRSPKRFATAALALLLTSHYVIRDLDDGGPHLILLAILVGGISCVWRGQVTKGAMWFGLATALKAPAGLFLPFFLWKRQWRLAGCSCAAAAFWIVLPIVWMGPPGWWTHQREWTRVALGSVSGHRTAVADISEQRVQNQALRPALMRYLVTYPEGHPLRLSHPGYRPGMGLSPATANALATGAMLGLLAIFCWRARQRYDGWADPAWLLESTAVLILGLLFSPVTWVQHLVLMMPALYLTVAEGGGFKTLGRAAATVMWAYVVLAIVLNREVLGKETYLLLLSYHIHTLAMLLVLGVIVFRRPTVAATTTVWQAVPGCCDRL